MREWRGVIGAGARTSGKYSAHPRGVDLLWFLQRLVSNGSGCLRDRKILRDGGSRAPARMRGSDMPTSTELRAAVYVIIAAAGDNEDTMVKRVLAGQAFCTGTAGAGEKRDRSGASTGGAANRIGLARSSAPDQCGHSRARMLPRLQRRPARISHQSRHGLWRSWPKSSTFAAVISCRSSRWSAMGRDGPPIDPLRMPA